MRLGYVTSTLPFGTREPFILPEVRALLAQGQDVQLFPMRPDGPIVHGDPAALLGVTIALPLIDREIVTSALAVIARHPLKAAGCLGLVFRSRSFRIATKNLLVIPKAFWLAHYLRRNRFEHLHCHWGGATATIAALASRLSGVGWSLTLHRWDIDEDNLLRIKCREAQFVRVISLSGYKALQARVPDVVPIVLHVGIEIGAPCSEPPVSTRGLVIGSLVDGKGHDVLLKALATLGTRGVGFCFDFAGSGPLAAELQADAERLGLGSMTNFLGHVSHRELLRRLRAGEWGIVVLPSTGPEGIPVALMEAAEANVATIGSSVGGVPELLGDEHGILVEPGNPTELADALGELLSNRDHRQRIAARGRRRVEAEFDVDAIAAQLVQLFGRREP